MAPVPVRVVLVPGPGLDERSSWRPNAGPALRGAWAAPVTAAAPKGRLVELPGAAHMTPQTHPAAVARILRYR